MDAEYVVVRTTHINDVDPRTGEIVPGWQVTVNDPQTGTTLPVFVPDSVWTPETVHDYTMQALATVRAVHSLGGQG